MNMTFKARHAPTNGLHFWAALCLASILGCNTGDYFASFFGLLNGLPALIAAFAIVLFFEQRSEGDSKAWYWIAILLVRTAATNLADFLARQVGIAAALAVLAVLLVAALLLLRVVRGAARPASSTGLPVIDGAYWLTMLIAGVLGTALGDFCASHSGLGLGHGVASLVLSLLVALLIAARLAPRLTIPVSYWLIVVMIRTAGTAVGDFFAHDIGLWQSTLFFAVLLATFLAVRGNRAAAPAAAR